MNVDILVSVCKEKKRDIKQNMGLQLWIYARTRNILLCLIIIIIIIIIIIHLLTYLPQLSFHSVAVVLTLVQKKQIGINIRTKNNTKAEHKNTKTQYKQYKTQ
jgi:hypothetical protein